MKDREVPQLIKEYVSAHLRRKRWLAVMSCLVCLTVICTNYALMQQATTLETDAVPDCSYVDHQHDDSCYDENGDLICEVLQHAHTEECQPNSEETQPGASVESDVFSLDRSA